MIWDLYSDVCDRSLTQEVWSRSKSSSCGICGGQIVTETKFSTASWLAC